MGPIAALRFLAFAAAPVLLVAVGVTPQEALSASIAVGSAGDIEAPAAGASKASLSSAGVKSTAAHASSQQQYPYSGSTAYGGGGSYAPSPTPMASTGAGGSGAGGGYSGAGGGLSGGYSGLAPKSATTAKSASSSSSGKTCVVPMWDSVTNVCAAGAGKAETYKDADKIKRTKAADGDLCTVTCPGTGTLSRNMIAPSVETMTCADGTWSDSKTQAPVAAIECATTSSGYLVSLVLFVAVAFMGNNWYNGKPLLEGTPFGGEPAPPAPEVAVEVHVESTAAPEANANAPAH